MLLLMHVHVIQWLRAPDCQLQPPRSGTAQRMRDIMQLCQTCCHILMCEAAHLSILLNVQAAGLHGVSTCSSSDTLI